ncbi:hypothetical protein HAX54_013691 [Datura stramonium]|uniref:Cytochrome f n=1 Tax=Datura stramonium TaxID=4076 RepID=A0ABS8TNI9_DATST|nr:hypothetical protein [Datura stramonium]
MLTSQFIRLPRQIPRLNPGQAVETTKLEYGRGRRNFWWSMIHRNNESPLISTHLRSPNAQEFLYSILCPCGDGVTEVFLRIQEKVMARRAIYHYDRCQVDGERSQFAKENKTASERCSDMLSFTTKKYWILLRIGPERRRKVGSKSPTEGRQVVDIIPPEPELLVSEGESIKFDQPLMSNPNVGGFVQGDAIELSRSFIIPKRTK